MLLAAGLLELIRSALGDYSVAFWISGGLCVAAGLSFLTIGRRAFAGGSERTRSPTAV